MLNNEEEDDDMTFYVKKTQPMILKSISGLNTYGNHAEQRIKTTREATPGIRPLIYNILSFFFYCQYR